MGISRSAFLSLSAVLATLGSLFVASCAVTPLGTIDGRVSSRYSGPPLKLAGGADSSTSAAETAPTIHRVAPGDTLYSLARRFDTTVEALLEANALSNPASLRAGSSLTIPRSNAPTSVTAEAPPSRPVPVEAPAPRPIPPQTAKQYPLLWPVQGTITSRFGQRDNRPHDGIDIAAPANTPVRAAAAGEVLFAGERGGYGNLILIRHTGGLITVYAHNARLLVRKGQRLQAGQMIARVGQTGNAQGPHLHFEVRRGVSPQNPLRFLPP